MLAAAGRPSSSSLSLTVLTGSPEARGGALARAFGDDARDAQVLFGAMIGMLGRGGAPMLPIARAALVDRALFASVGRRMLAKLDADARGVVRALSRET